VDATQTGQLFSALGEQLAGHSQRVELVVLGGRRHDPGDGDSGGRGEHAASASR